MHISDRNLILIFQVQSSYFPLLEAAATQQEAINIQLHKLWKIIWFEVNKCCLSMRNFITVSQLINKWNLTTFQINICQNQRLI